MTEEEQRTKAILKLEEENSKLKKENAEAKKIIEELLCYFRVNSYPYQILEVLGEAEAFIK